MSMNCKGFILIDLLLSLTSLLILITILSPFIIKIHAVKQDIEIAMVADEYLNEQILEQITHNKELASVEYPIYHKSKELYFQLNVFENKLLACLNWTTTKNDEERICRYVPI